MGLFSSLFGGDAKNPADAAMPYLKQIPETIKPYYQPYITAGGTALNTLMPEYQRLISDPTALMTAIGQKYQASPGYQYNVGQATNASNQAAAAGGMVGTPAQQQELAKVISGLASQDYGNYMNQALGQYGMGLQGMGGINQLGYGASTSLAQNLMDALMSQAQMAYGGQIAQNQTGGGGILGGLGGLLGGLGGFMFGGPAGAAGGYKLGSSVFGGGNKSGGGMSWTDLQNYLPKSDFL